MAPSAGTSTTEPRKRRKQTSAQGARRKQSPTLPGSVAAHSRAARDGALGRDSVKSQPFGVPFYGYEHPGAL